MTEKTTAQLVLEQIRDIAQTSLPPTNLGLTASEYEYAVYRLRRIAQLADAALETNSPAPQPIEHHIWVDGGCKKQGTPEALGYFSFQVDSQPPHRLMLDADLPQTNNVAEYKALKTALQWIAWNAEDWKKVTIHTDSQLVVGQLTQDWKVNAGTIKSLWRECAQLLDELGNVTLVKEPRERIEAVLGH